MGTKSIIHNFTRLLNLSVIAGSLILSSCVENSGVRSKVSKAVGNLSGTSGSTNGAASLPNNTSVGTGDTLQSIKVELSHLVDPFDGTYKKKVSIPKNYKGNLYIAGLNISAIQDKLVKVRFKFGTDSQAVVLDATVARAPGIVPTTEIQVLVVDMNSRPFKNMRLGYDLYDYNNYVADTSKVPVQDPRDSGLYCRGLKLADDPTFNNTSTTTATCSTSSDKCLYAYAKIADATLYTYNSSTNVYLTSIPSRPQVWTEASGTRTPSFAASLNTMCLPDDSSASVSGINSLFNVALPGPSISFGTGIGSYYYRGPYRAINDTAWNISEAALFRYDSANKEYTGLFESSYNYTSGNRTGYRSLMFPRAGTMALNQDVRYQGSVGFFDQRGSLVADATGTTKYVDGCNLRVQNYDPVTTEGIQSCNVNGSIEVFYLKDNVEVSITKDTSIKLQLLRASLTNSEGKEVLSSAFKQCESSSTCGSSECCFNKRCWSKELVTQCVDQTPVIGNQEIGANCASDYECSSLCCNQSTGSCAPHNPNGTVPVLCSKTAGQRCVSQEFCKPDYVSTCKLTKSAALKPDGTAACEMRCTPVLTYGQCAGGYCTPPVVPAAVPANWDGVDCTQAVDP